MPRCLTPSIRLSGDIDRTWCNCLRTPPHRRKPLAMDKPSQFRPGPPVSLESKEWAADYNEIKGIGGQASAKRTAQQTEVARFWAFGPTAAYHPFARQLVTAKQLNVVDSARFM